MHANEQLIVHFYTAFNSKDYATMQRAYHADAVFYDPVFQNLSANEVKAMWQMLVTSAKDLKVTFSKIEADDKKGSCTWEAFYTFTGTGKKVHNVIHASFDFQDGKIKRHRDHFDLWKWTRMALGIPGILLGWSPIVTGKVRKTAQGKLKKFMSDRIGVK